MLLEALRRSGRLSKRALSPPRSHRLRKACATAEAKPPMARLWPRRPCL